MPFAATRRQLLKAMAAAGLLNFLPVSGIARLGFAATSASQKPILIVIHMRGGCDGLNFLSPATDPDFIAARVSDLRVPADGAAAGFSLKNSADGTIDFRLHAAAAGLNELYGNGNLAFIHACGLTDATRSHFVATDMIEHGVASDQNLARTNSGWIARALETGGAEQSGFRAMAASGSTAGDLAGYAQAMAIPDINYGLGSIGGPQVENVLWQLYASQQGELADAGRSALRMCADIDIRIPRDAQGHIQPYQPMQGVNYDPAADFARPLKTIAELIKMEIGLEMATMDFGDWDTHENQPARFHGQVDRLSKGIAAFWNDMSAYHDRLTIVTLTEFGRRLRGNKSTGTDHGRAGVMMALGGRIAGGRMHGRWPGLKSEQLDEGVDLAVATDYRQPLTELLVQRHGKIDAQWFPDYNYPGPLGLVT